MKKAKKSDAISEFIKLLDKIKSDYDYSYSIVGQLDIKFNQDLTHDIELKPAKDKNKIATKMRTNRLDRRYYKDIVEECEPLYELMTNPQYKKAFDMIKQALGKTRKQEDYHANRTYKPRITKENEIVKKII